MSCDFNGTGGVKWFTLVPLLVILVGSAAVWGETRLQVRENISEISDIKEDLNEEKRIYNEITTQQAVMNEKLKSIKEAQEEQKKTLETILRELRRSPSTDFRGR